MASVTVYTVPPITAWDSGVAGAGTIYVSGTTFDDSVLSAVQSAATAAGVSLSVGTPVAPPNNALITYAQAEALFSNDTDTDLDVGTVLDLTAYNVSASANSYVGSGGASTNLVTLTTSHDFQVGQGVRLYGAGSTGDTTVPPTPTIGAVGTNSATVTYQYQIASILSLSYAHPVECCSPASAVATFSGNSSLSSSNYNTISWAPGAGTGQTAYVVYGRTSGSMAPIGYIWYEGAVHFSASLVSSGNAPPFIGANLSPSTTYNYCVTGVDLIGNETPPLYHYTGVQTVTATTGATVTGIALNWDYYNGTLYPYRYWNIYRATGAGPMQFLAQVGAFDWVYNDYGLVAPNAGITPPTTLKFTDTGQTQITGTAARPAYVPLSPPAATVNQSLYSTVTATTSTTITLAANLSTTVSSAVVVHDDSVGLNAALTALGYVSLPNGYYPIHQATTVPGGGTLRGQNPPLPKGVTVTATTNPLPNPNCATIALHRLTPGQHLIPSGTSSALRNLQLFWPNQSNGVLSGAGSTNSQAVIPYPAAILPAFGNIGLEVTGIVDCNSFVGMHCNNDNGIVKDFWAGAFRYEIMGVAGEMVFDTFKGDDNQSYSGNVNLPPAVDRTVLRLNTGSSLPTICNIAVDNATAVWMTTGNFSQGGNGAIGAVISDVWTDDVSPGLVFDAPVSDCYNGGGQVFAHRISNYYGIPGTGPINISTGLTNLGGGANEADISFSNSRLPSITVTGQLRMVLTGCAHGPITATASSPWIATPYIEITEAGCVSLSTTRYQVNGGHVKAFWGASMCSLGNNATSDTVSAGSLYVVDDQTMTTERFYIPSGTALATGDNTIGHIVMVQGGGNSSLYVVNASGSGTSATDVWKLNGSALFTTSATVSSLKVGGAGEGKGGTALPILSALLTIANPSGSSFVVLPVVLNVAVGLTTSTPLECRITYCVTPQGI